MEKVKICCLFRKPNKKETFQPFDLISLEGKHQVIIGRSPETADISIPSPMISRKHAILMHNANTNVWSITDNKSLNGIYINGKKLKALTAHQLSEGDKVQLGVQEKPELPAQFVYTFYTQFKAKACPKSKLHRVDSQSDKKRAASIEDWDGREEGTRARGGESSKRLCVRPDVNDAQVEEARKKMEEMEMKLKESEDAKKKLEEFMEKQKSQEQQAAAAQKKLEEMEKRLHEKEEERMEYEENLVKMKEELVRKEREKEEEMLAERERLAKEAQMEYEKSLKSKEVELRSRLELEQKMALTAQQHRLDQLMLSREMSQHELEQRLADSQAKSEAKDEEKIKAMKAEILGNFTELLESELKCSICNELFIKATSLECSHSYCSLCIAQWMDIKKECCVCRKPITSTVRSIVLDSYIDKMVEQLSDEMKADRKALIEERAEEEKKREEAKKAKQAAARSTSRGRRRGQGRSRANRRGRARGGHGSARQTAAPIVVSSSESDHVLDESVIPDDVAEYLTSGWTSDEEDSYYSILVSDSDSNSEDSSDDDDDDDELLSNTEFRPGDCFNCGRWGHWAYSCPY